MEKEASKLNSLVGKDSDNIAASRQALNDIEPASLMAVEKAAEVLDNVPQLFGKICEYAKHHKVVSDWALSMGLRGEEELQLVRDAVLIGKPQASDQSEMAKESLEKAVSIISRCQLSLRLGRDFLFGTTDLLRLRITPALGYLRLQSETIAILRLLYEKPQMSEEWLASAYPDGGKPFYDKWHREILKRIRDFGLHPDYLFGTNMALHSRASGLSMGIMVGASEKEIPGQTRFAYQEADDPGTLFFWFGMFLRFHQKLLLHLKDIFPELDSSAIDSSGLPEFLRLEQTVWTKVREKHSRSKLRAI